VAAATPRQLFGIGPNSVLLTRKVSEKLEKTA